jgi:hypothetical protein
VFRYSSFSDWTFWIPYAFNRSSVRKLFKHGTTSFTWRYSIDFSHKLVLQHDGARPHFSHNVQGILNRMYPNRWMGRDGPRHWLAWSPDLSPLDFFWWGHVKNVYNWPIHNEEDLRNRLQGSFGTITPKMVRASKLSLLQRAQLCVEMNGGHFEHLLSFFLLSFSFLGVSLCYYLLSFY